MPSSRTRFSVECSLRLRAATAVVVVLLTVLAAVPSQAGGGAENIFLVVNASSASSVAIANAYVELRKIPAINVLMLPWDGSRDAIPIATFRSDLLQPIMAAIGNRRLATQIDQIVYSSDFPWRIDFAAELPAELVGRDKFPSGSLTGMTMLYSAVQSGAPTYLEAGSNRYWRPLGEGGVPSETQGFRGWYGWGPAGEVLEAGGPRYALSTVLGVTTGRGNSAAEVIACLRSAARADFTRPQGTIYFSTTTDVRSTTRTPGFAGVIAELHRLGVKAETLPEALPVRKKDVAGLMTGVPDFDWAKSGSSILPGAICENLTSLGGIFTPSAGQTPLTAFIRSGASGSSGTVIEPYALQEKFPHASIQVHYARGASLAEAFYQSVQAPYQLLVVGDPLCQPWAKAPVVEATTSPGDTPLEPGRRLSGMVMIQATGRVPEGEEVNRFEFFVDGVRSGQCGQGESHTLDTRLLADGHHEIRVVGIEPSTVETQGRLIVPVICDNHGRSLELRVKPHRIKANGKVRVSVWGENLKNTAIFSTGRVLGRATGADATVEFPAEVLGIGTVTIHATGHTDGENAGTVNATPVTIEVVPAD